MAEKFEIGTEQLDRVATGEPDEEWPPVVGRAYARARAVLDKQRPGLEEISRLNHRRMMEAFRGARVAASDLHGSTGYGLDDRGREGADRIVAALMGAECALVRQQFVSGTHAISAALFGNLLPGDGVMSVTGLPYDTLQTVLGIRGEAAGSLAEYGVSFQSVELTVENDFDYTAIEKRVTPEIRMFLVQRSKGYAWQGAVNMGQIAEFVRFAKERFPDRIIFVDNCYGELVEEVEPGHVGADLMAGSLIKNLGGTLMPSGGYVAGKRALVERAAARFAAPGIGMKLGATGDTVRLMLQGLYMSPLTVCEALKGAVFAAAFWQELGFDVNPGPEAARTDIIQAVRLKSPEGMVAFCQGLQAGSPVDAHVCPVPGEMPGYADEIIMAGGTFVQGATSEFSADGPLRPPYSVFLQGGCSCRYLEEIHVRAALFMEGLGLLAVDN
ncbi:MAG: methionine gamma-lyase family protein [Gracilibacteraceae bacterium]|jgi:cystathionine beta-lyase family protein involved in aluminum resistance|nr:methionine gamma-lyase family protein [Gracilibacteraceae bacterium]